MATVNTSFVVPCTQDRAVLAVQDCVNQLGWPVLEVSSSLIVIQGPGSSPVQMANFPKISLQFEPKSSDTQIDITISVIGPMLGWKKNLTGIMGRLTNAISIRIQTESLSINPTVAIGQGQPFESITNQAFGKRDRAQQLMDLKALLDEGILTEEEFAIEKSKILNS